jgi:hypothetical protein
MFNPKDPKIQANLPKIREILKNDLVEVFVLPTAKLREMILKNEHPIIQKLGPSTKKVFLQGNGLLIQKKMIWNWINGTLDENHAFILSLSEVRIREDGNVLLGQNGGK